MANNTTMAIEPVTNASAASVTLAVFVLTVLLVVLAETFPSRMRVPFWLFPPVGCVILLAAQAVPPDTIWQGAIVGDASVQPYAVLIVFYSLAYVCLSLDASGALGLASQAMINKARGSWFRLFSIIAMLSAVLTVATSNDVVILTLTPLVIKSCRLAKLDSTPFLLLQFFFANILSAVLIIGNPTNIVLGVAMNVSFIRFFILMVLPSTVCALAMYALGCAYFRKHLTETFVVEAIDPKSLLVDPAGAVVQSAVLLCTLILFPAITMTVASSKLWHVALAGGLASLAVDLARLPLWRASEEPLTDGNAPRSPHDDNEPDESTAKKMKSAVATCMNRCNAARTARLVRLPDVPWTKVPTVMGIFGCMPLGLLPFVCVSTSPLVVLLAARANASDE